MGKTKIHRHDGKISAMDAQNVKRELRSDLKARRAAAEYNPDDAAAINVNLAEICLMIGASKIACYLPFGNEPDTELFIDWALENQIEVILPVAKTDGNLAWVTFEGETEAGIFGFAEAAGADTSIEGIDLMIIPAMAVDQKGMRLGKGKGYYDRTLEALTVKPPIVAVVFDDELLEVVPAEEHDQPVDAVVTPKQRVIFNDRLK